MVAALEQFMRTSSPSAAEQEAVRSAWLDAALATVSRASPRRLRHGPKNLVEVAFGSLLTWSALGSTLAPSRQRLLTQRAVFQSPFGTFSDSLTLDHPTNEEVMEPASLNTEGAGHGARMGSLENPEVIENVPGHVIPILEQEFDDFDTESARFLRGDLEDDEFIKFRLRQGVYGQRQPDVQMIRVKLPMGGVTPDQLDAFAAGIERYVPLRKGHITTRQNIQMHHIPLPDAAKLIRDLGDAGLSSREGCGNTVRNVTGDPRAGVLPDELFDVTPYAGAYVRYFVRHPTTQAMPRKFKTAFAATEEDNAITRIHDMAFLPRLRDGVRGVEVRVGGGTSIMPRLAPTLYEFVELDNGDYLKITEAVVRIFDRQDFLRVNRARARIKVLIDKIGIDAFRELVEEELQGDWVSERNFSLDGILYEHDEQADAPAAPISTGSPNGDGSEFNRFLATNVQAQRQPGFSTVEINVRRGDLTPEQLRGIAQIMRDFTGGSARTTVHQNLVLRWVRDEAAYDVWQRLSELELGDAGADEITDVVSCPGTDSCKLGITSSMGLNQAVARAPDADADRRRADAADPHQDERLPQRLRPASHRQHRLLRGLAQGRRAHNSGVHRAYRRLVRGR